MTRSIHTLALACFTLAAAPLVTGQAPPNPHIRSTDTEILDALSRGVTVSPTLQRLVDRLEASDVVVYVGYDRVSSPTMSGHLSLITAVQGRRYLRVSIDRRLAGCQRLAILGHELQHAVEIAESPKVTDDASLTDLYRRIGFRSAGATTDCFDSVGAILAGRTVEKEVMASAAAPQERR